VEVGHLVDVEIIYLEDVEVGECYPKSGVDVESTEIIKNIIKFM